MSASEQDLERAAEDLLSETNDGRLLAYLAVFRPRRFPGDPTRLVPLLGSDNKRVVFSAVSVLGQISAPAIRERAHQLIAEGHPDLGARLLRSSYGEGDLALLKALLDRLASDKDVYHRTRRAPAVPAGAPDLPRMRSRRSSPHLGSPREAAAPARTRAAPRRCMSGGAVLLGQFVGCLERKPGRD